MVFISYLYPVNFHWACAVIRQNKHKCTEMVILDSSPLTAKYKEYMARTICCVMRTMDTTLPFSRFCLSTPASAELYQRYDQLRCGMHVIARAWQVARGVQNIMTLKDVDVVDEYLQYEFMRGNEHLCGEKLSPLYDNKD